MSAQKRRIYPGLKKIGPLVPVVFKTINERNRYVIEMRMQGHTLQDIANSIDLTREMVRLIVEAHSGPTKRKREK